MKTLSNLNTKAVLGTFMDAEKNPLFEKSDVVALGVAFDITASYGKGAWFGPHAVFDASHQIEWEVPIFCEPLVSKVKIHNVGVLEYPRTLQKGKLQAFDDEKISSLCKQMVHDVKEASAQALKAEKLLFLIGGEHSILNGAFESLADQYNPEEVTLLQFDAHLDLRDTYWNQKYSHACVMKRARDHGFPLIQVGIRDRFDKTQAAFIRKEKRSDWIFFCQSQPLHMYDAYENIVKNTGVLVQENMIVNGELSDRQIGRILSKITTKYLWLTIDIDGLDSQIVPATGTPMPHGLSLASVEKTIYHALMHCHKKGIRLLGFDVTEVAPMLRDPDKGYEVGNTISTVTEMNAALLASNILFWTYLERFEPQK